MPVYGPFLPACKFAAASRGPSPGIRRQAVASNIQGVGDLVHLGIQFANRFGYHVVAVGRGPENGALAKNLGAHDYLDSAAVNAAEELKKRGGAAVILATAPSSKAMSEIFHGLGRNGKLLVSGADTARDSDRGPHRGAAGPTGLGRRRAQRF